MPTWMIIGWLSVNSLLLIWLGGGVDQTADRLRSLENRLRPRWQPGDPDP